MVTLRNHETFVVFQCHKVRNKFCEDRSPEICALLGYYAASCGNCLPTFRDNVSVPSSRVKSPSRKERKPASYNIDSGKYGGVAISRRDIRN
jgi:hypothetical protein